MLLSRKRLLLSCVTTAAVAVAVAPAAGAANHANDRHPSGWSRTLTKDVILPFGIAVDKNDRVYVADGGKDLVSRVEANGSLTTLAHGLPGGDVAGVDVAADGSYAYTTSHGDRVHDAAELVIKEAGKPDVVADILAYETAHNPDARNTYGLPAGTDCQQGRDWLGQGTGGPSTYTGLVDSHPYAVASLGGGSWAVADAGANAIFRVSPAGQVSTISVLPPQKLTITQAVLNSASVDATGNPVPVPDYATCLIGKTYGFEPVPTDVEVGPAGQFWVSTLPGGPEDPSLGARGSVYLVNPGSGWSFRLATGFAGATNLAVTPEGTTYVSEFFGGKITKVTLGGHKSTFKTVDSPLGLEVKGAYVYAALAGIGATGPNGQGAIIKYQR